MNEFPGEDDREIADDGHVLGLLAAYALGALDPDENERVVRHVQSCDNCRAELAGHEVAASLLAYSAPPRLVPLRVRARLLGCLDELGTANGEHMVVLRPARTATGRRHGRSWLPRLPAFRFPISPRIAAAAALPIALALALILAMGDRINDQRQELAEIRDEEGRTTDMLVATDSTPRFERAFVSSAVAPDALGRLIVDGARNRAMMLAVNLPFPAADKHYVVWLRFDSGAEYARVGVLEVDDEGRAKLIVEPDSPISQFEAVVVTVETNADATAPSGPELMTVGMSPAQ